VPRLRDSWVRHLIFWHRELEYVIYLLGNIVFRGETAVDMLGWTEERRQDLKLRQEELAATSQFFF
jgi:hypothetical protein